MQKLKLVSSFELFHQEIDKLKIIFQNNGYPKSFVDFCIKNNLDQVFIKKEAVLKASKMELICVLPFIGKKSLQLRPRSVNSIESNLKCWNLNSLFHYTDSLKKIIRSDIVYRFTYSNCKVTNYGKTYRHFFTKATEHMGTSNLTGKRHKSVKQSAASNHLLECNCSIDFGHFNILTSDPNKFELFIKESLLIKRDQPQLKTKPSSHFR